MRTLVVLAVSTASAAAAAPPEFSPHDLRTVFFFTTSDNPTRIDYALRLGEGCAPSGDEPLFPYWHYLGDGSPGNEKTNSLKFFEYPAYGVREQKIKRLPRGAEITVKLKAVEREIVITVEAHGDECTATPRTTIAGQPGSQLLSVHITVKTGWRVDHVDIRGRTADGAAITERLTQ
jgi:hypothetical protein